MFRVTLNYLVRWGSDGGCRRPCFNRQGNTIATTKTHLRKVSGMIVTGDSYAFIHADKTVLTQDLPYLTD